MIDLVNTNKERDAELLCRRENFLNLVAVKAVETNQAEVLELLNIGSNFFKGLASSVAWDAFVRRIGNTGALESTRGECYMTC